MKSILAGFSLLAAASAADQQGVVLRITPGAGVEASTYNAGAFELINRSGRPLANLVIDLSTTAEAGLLFDPDGLAGDTVGKPFTVDGEQGAKVASHALDLPDGEGWRRLTLHLADCPPGGRLSFSIDVDPSWIRGSAPPGPNGAGSVSGAELAGGTVIAVFADGTTARARIEADPGDPGGGLAVLY